MGSPASPKESQLINRPTIIQDKQRVDQIYHEAQRRAAVPQPIVKYNKPKSLLLTAPNNIIFELFNTIVKEWPNDKLVAFITRNLREYLDVNWTNKTTQQVIKRLRREQALDARAGLTDIPFIKKRRPQSPRQSKNSSRMSTVGSPKSPSAQKSPPLNYENSPNNKSIAITQICDHVMWRVRTENVTQITSLLVKLVIDDGYKRGNLKSEAYGDVGTCFHDWRSIKLIKLYSFGDAPANDQRLILASTTAGDLTKWVANYIDGSEKRVNPDLIRKLAMALRDKTKNCIFLTHNINDAIKSYETDAFRLVLVVDRLKAYDNLKSLPNFAIVEPLMINGKIYIVDSLDCVEFAPDPTSDACC